LVIRGGQLVDGTGEAARTADVAVRDGIIVETGKVSGRGARNVDAGGAVVAPGFVDIHTHYDGQATWDRQLQPSSWHYRAAGSDRRIAPFYEALALFRNAGIFRGIAQRAAAGTATAANAAEQGATASAYLDRALAVTRKS
jgi:cytosine/adenosine deaminase-related metal-dependent hydrolase